MKTEDLLSRLDNIADKLAFIDPQLSIEISEISHYLSLELASPLALQLEDHNSSKVSQSDSFKCKCSHCLSLIPHKLAIIPGYPDDVEI